MRKTGSAQDSVARQRIDTLLRDVMMSLFAAGALAIGVLWALESRLGLIDETARLTYPAMLVVFVASAAMLYRWPNTVPLARWFGFLAISIFLFLELIAALWRGGPLVGNYAFISLLMWLPLAYAIALFMLDAREAPWAAGALFVLIASASAAYMLRDGTSDSGDTAMLINLLTSHVVLLACLSGLVKIKQALFRAEAQSRRLLEQASTDPLTGLANRRHGLKMLRQAAEDHAPDRPSAVILCDVDCFKEINDRYGHDVGDKVVLAISDVLRDNTRGLDTVIRWGGDEFLIVVPQIASFALREMAERLRVCVSEAMADDEVSPSLSIGVAEMGESESLERWIKRADEALYLAKLGGRNRCVYARSTTSGGTRKASSETEIVAETVLDAEAPN